MYCKSKQSQMQKSATFPEIKTHVVGILIISAKFLFYLSDKYETLCLELPTFYLLTKLLFKYSALMKSCLGLYVNHLFC